MTTVHMTLGLVNFLSSFHSFVAFAAELAKDNCVLLDNMVLL
jgi:hypothetical protein